MQLALDALDRLVEMLEERGPLSAVEAARQLFAMASVSEGMACSLLCQVIAGDGRLSLSGTIVSLAGCRPDPLLEETEFVVFDLETTGLSADAVASASSELSVYARSNWIDSFQALVNPGLPLPQAIERLTGLRDQELRLAPSAATVVERFLVFAGEARLVAHNARFDQRFLERQLERMQGRRLAEPRSARPRSLAGS